VNTQTTKNQVSRSTQPIDHPKEDLVWSGISLRPLNDSELVQQVAADEKTHLHRGILWRQIKPFFWTPCVPFQLLDHTKTQPKPALALAGFTHLSEPGSPSNGIYRAIVRDRISEYSIGSLSTDRRTKVRKALANLDVRLVEYQDILRDGHEVYKSWHRRVRWGRDKSRTVTFENWISKVCRRPKFMVLGAYRSDKLVAFMLPHAYGSVAVQAYVASHTEYLKYRPNEAIIHAFLCIARQTPGIEMADLGTISSKTSLDDFKLNFGRIKEFPSYTWINPLARPFLNNWIHRRYPWLNGTANSANGGSETGSLIS
jgi:hypothetical protein